MSAEDELRQTVEAWDRAMLSNDAARIGEFMSDDWVITGSDGRRQTKQGFLAVVASGALTHHTMESKGLEVRIYGDAAVVLAHGVSAGAFAGQSFSENERQSNVFVKQGGKWRCVMTHLSRVVE
jgi:uncharacterized protein (TIGR02246 family)